MLAVFVTVVLLHGLAYRLDRPAGRFEGLARDLGAVEDTLLRTTESLVLRGDTAISDGLGRRGRDGAFYSRFALGTPLVHAPLYAAGRFVSGGRREPAWQTARLTGLLLGALIVALVYRLGRVLGAGPLGATAAAMMTAATTVLWPYALWVTPQLTSTVGVATAAVGALSYRRYPRMQSMATTSVGLTLAVLAQPANALLVPIVLVYVFADRPRRLLPQMRRLPVFVLPVAAALAWTLWHNHARFGHWLAFLGSGFTPPIGADGRRPWLGIPTSHAFQRPSASICGFGLGSVWFNPLLVLGLGVLVWLLVKRRREAVLLAAMSVTVLLTAVARWDWSGGEAWGPVRLLEVVPLLAAPAALALTPRRRSRPAWFLAGGLACAGLAIQAPLLLARNAEGRLLFWWRDWPWVGALLTVAAVTAAALVIRASLRHDREANAL